ncbi:V-set and immunoglobulin domain-containing protein 10-like 2 [Astyanax mexicanus]|uniref:V-set and immunoglobulin domain-containing protein 10-like 2 n=1 Tax=Astyanax mexicanus TaxID=7994 RepID=UPI0020CAD9BD|nr:V-set and immunoglobulin domain-containing protein 10-like 2 [Astyanax mexicanus]
MPKKYILQQAAPWYNLTVRDTDSAVDSGQYWCSAANAVGRTEMPIQLQVMKYPVPPNITISKVTYSGRQRTDVNVEWTNQTDGDITGFIIEYQRLPNPLERSDIASLWQKVAVDVQPSVHNYQINNLDPGRAYTFRVTAVNRRTVGNPSDIKSPVSMSVSKPYPVLSDPSPVEGTPLWMRCGLENGTEPINYTWEQESQSGLVTTLTQSSNSSLINISWVTRNHTGWYRCLAKNEVNQQYSDRVWLDVIYGPDLPQIDVTPSSGTEGGFSALEKGNISLMCQASSNPASQYYWFYNNSHIYSRPQLTIIKILRMQTGNYTCQAKNSYLNTTSTKTTTLTVYYPPDGAPSCNMSPVNNYSDLALSCSWVGGDPPATVKWSPYSNGTKNREGITNITQIQSGSDTANNSVFTCYGSHVALNVPQSCTTRTWLPYGEPQCSANSSWDNEYLLLSCSWEGGVPQALLWWASGSGDIQGSSEENSNSLLLRSSSNYSGKAFVCHAKHPLANKSRQCVLKMEAPVLVAQRSVVSVLEGSDVQLSCILNRSYPAVTEISWRSNTQQRVEDKPLKYTVKQAAGWSNLTVRETDGMTDSGQFWCSTANAVGKAEIPITLLVIMPVSKPYVLLSDSSPVEGMSLWMRCVVEKGTGPVNYSWEQESQSGLLTTPASWNNSLVNVTSVTRNHSGWYRCLARNAVNQQRSEHTWLDVLYGPDLPQVDVAAYSVTALGYSALEKGSVSLMCQASSNPPCQYTWFYNNSEIYTGSQLTITKLLRGNSGYYSCLAQNTQLNTRSKKTITLTVYYPPDGVPSCSIFPSNNYTNLALYCSWEGGYPPATLKWSPYVNGDNPQGLGNITRIQAGPDTANSSVFTCYGSHVALPTTQSCSTRTWLPYGEPQCSVYVTRNNEYLMLSCSWEGGFPLALLWWVSSSGDMQGTSEENSNILILRSGATNSGKAFVCHAKHPLIKESKQCVLKLEAPVLMTQRSVVSVYEGNDVQLTCILSKNYPAATDVTWYNNLKQNVGDTPNKYILQQAAAWSNLTVRETDSRIDSGQYWCSATNAVGGAEIPVLLVVMRYPMPPNVTISKLTYNSQQRRDVTVDWLLQTDGQLTGFLIEQQKLPGSVGKSEIVSSWQKVVENLEPGTRSHQINNLEPTGKYAFRVTAVNHRTTGHPSQIRSPAPPPFHAYPAVIGAAIGGMLVATVLTVLIFIYVMRNRNNIPRLHDMIFGSQSRENINLPEDEISGGAEGH